VPYYAAGVRLILASRSPRRADLLRAAGFEFDVLACDVDEQVRPQEPADAYVRRLATEKSAEAQRLAAHWARGGKGSDADGIILAADTAVVVDGAILGKPRDTAEARDMLERLSDRRHEVLTGLSLRWSGRELGHVERTAVFFAPLGNAEIDWYVQSGEGMDKAGAYAIQGLASRFVTRIEGSYSNVVGLPISAVYTSLKASFSGRRPL
jgi:septum formation protein